MQKKCIYCWQIAPVVSWLSWGPVENTEDLDTTTILPLTGFWLDKYEKSYDGLRQLCGTYGELVKGKWKPGTGCTWEQQRRVEIDNPKKRDYAFRREADRERLRREDAEGGSAPISGPYPSRFRCSGQIRFSVGKERWAHKVEVELIHDSETGRWVEKGKSGFDGVTWVKSRRKWQAQMWVDKKNHHLGYYDTWEEARGAYLDMKNYFVDKEINSES